MEKALPLRTKKPDWLRKKLSFNETAEIKRSLRKKNLHTVCESARCPNIGECFSRKTATFMILGDICNRTCGYCAVQRGIPASPDPSEPDNIARMVKELGITHAVITSVTRDDLHDGGAEQFAKTVRAVRRDNPSTMIELLIPDFKGDTDALDAVLREKPEILNHNIETVERLYPLIRPQADFTRSIGVLKRSSLRNVTVKSGIMIGFGEEEKELMTTFENLKDAGVEILTIGQYLSPSKGHLPVAEYFPQERFDTLAESARSIGIPTVFSAPFVRSSYMAEDVAKLEKSGS
ncbi:MAG: lipoyl synthase [Nitrospinota bacterium]|nr:lipoyl synthase [Nitrospinota bacterium]